MEQYQEQFQKQSQEQSQKQSQKQSQFFHQTVPKVEHGTINIYIHTKDQENSKAVDNSRLGHLVDNPKPGGQATYRAGMDESKWKVVDGKRMICWLSVMSLLEKYGYMATYAKGYRRLLRLLQEWRSGGIGVWFDWPAGEVQTVLACIRYQCVSFYGAGRESMA